MRTIWRSAPAAALLWSAAARAVTAQVGPEATPPPPPLPEPRPDSAPVEPTPADLGPDTLPSLEEPPSLTPPPAPPAVATPPTTARRPLPVRAERRLALLGELGWNSLAGVGPSVTFHAHPHVSFDLGAGLGAVGGKIGLRARANVLTKEVTPFFGAGAIVASGFDAPSANFASDMENRELNVKVLPSAFVQAVTGVDWTSRNGFTLVGALGYAFLVTRDNVEIITGEPTAEERRGLRAAFGSSLVISIAIGYSFR
jgi:hypothetical protein